MLCPPETRDGEKRFCHQFALCEPDRYFHTRAAATAPEKIGGSSDNNSPARPCPKLHAVAGDCNDDATYQNCSAYRQSRQSCGGPTTRLSKSDESARPCPESADDKADCD